MARQARQHGTHGRVYGGDPSLVHIADGSRRAFGADMADYLENRMRAKATPQPTEGKRLCPGCYMIAGFNMLVTLATRNGQSISELAHTMAHAFELLQGDGRDHGTEEITVLLDPPEVTA